MAFHPGETPPLPWGWWLRAIGDRLVDEHGRGWKTVRDAFWQGHLGFPDAHFAPEQHELLLRVLAAIDRPYGDGIEHEHDLFAGNMAAWRFYMCWLHSVGLTNGGELGSALEARLSPLGAAVLIMLLATREPGYAAMSFDGVLDEVRAAARTAEDDARERALRSFERGVVRLLFLFARETLAGRPVVTLTGFADGRMPTRRVMWSQAFADEDARDRFFEWMTQRVDRWEDWGAMAYRRGADALTTHLLGLLAARLPAA